MAFAVVFGAAANRGCDPFGPTNLRNCIVWFATLNTFLEFLRRGFFSRLDRAHLEDNL